MSKRKTWERRQEHMTRYAVDRIEEGFALLEVEKDGVCRME